MSRDEDDTASFVSLIMSSRESKLEVQAESVLEVLEFLGLPQERGQEAAVTVLRVLKGFRELSYMMPSGD